MTGDDHSISFEPIVLEIQKVNQKSMTIIDLPGVTRLSKDNKIPDIEEKIKSLYKHYMKQENTIIVNICTAAVDFENHVSLNLSRQIDQKSERTIICLTQIDMVKNSNFQKKFEKFVSDF